MRKKDGEIENKNSRLATYAIEATPEIQEKNKNQIAAYERHIKSQAKFLQIIKNQGYDLSTESLEILGEAWDRCKESK